MRLGRHHIYPCTLPCLTLPTPLPAVAAAGPGVMPRLPLAVRMDILKQVATYQKWPPGWAYDGSRNLLTVNHILDWNMQHNLQVGPVLLGSCSVLWCSRVCASLCLGCLQWCPVAGQDSTMAPLWILCNMLKPVVGASTVSAAAASARSCHGMFGSYRQCQAGSVRQAKIGLPEIDKAEAEMVSVAHHLQLRCYSGQQLAF